MRGRNTILSNYNYRVDPKIGKYVCDISIIPCECKTCVSQLDKYYLPNCDPLSQPRYDCVEKCYYKKVI